MPGFENREKQKALTVEKNASRGMKSVGHQAQEDNAGIQQKQGLDMDNTANTAWVGMGVPLIPEKLKGAFYLTVNSDDPPAAWESIANTLEQNTNADSQIEPLNDSETDYRAFTIKFFNDSYMLARSTLCQLEGDDQLLLEMNRLEGDGFGFADLFVKEFGENVGDICDPPEMIEDPELEAARQENLNDEFLQLDADIGNEMVEHWLTNLRPAGGVKYDHMKIYETLSTLGWNCQESSNYEILREYSDDIVGPVLNILHNEDMDFIPSLFYGSKILRTFATQGGFNEEMLNYDTVATVCSIALKACGGVDGFESKHQVKTSKEVLSLLFDTVEALATQVAGQERSGEAGDCLELFVNKSAGMFGNDNMNDRIAAVADVMGIALEEEVV